jgi:hypothetical protein
MKISKAYQDTLKRRTVQRFIVENNRSPTEAELRDLFIKSKREYPSVDQVGISGYDIVKPQFKDRSSIVDENQNRRAIFSDMSTMSSRLDELAQLLEDSFRGFISTKIRTSGLLNQLESRLDNLLLLNGNVDVFIEGIEETFDTQESIDFSKTTASVESGFCTLGRTGYSVVDLAEAKISYSAIAEKGLVGTQVSSPIEYLKEEDGTFWEYLVYTNTRQGRVTAVIDIDLDDSAYVNDLRFVANPVSVNKKATYTAFYSLDAQTYTAVEPVERVVVSGENQVNIGIEGVKKVRINISKDVSDNTTTVQNQYVYVFSLDSLKLYTDQYVSSNISELYAGPYSIVDQEGQNVNFTKATLTACTISADNTSVSFFLSKDNATWLPVNTKDSAGAVVSFTDGSRAGTWNVIDETQTENRLTEIVPPLLEVDFSTEAIINIEVDEAFAPLVPFSSISVKRNIVDPSLLDEIYQVAPGWYLDHSTSQYTTTVYVDAPEGRYLDLGHTGAFINGAAVNGLVHLTQGTSVFATSDANWREIPVGLVDLQSLKREDPLYPYNHKYIIEGYNYTGAFAGEQFYAGVAEYYGRLLEYVPPELFNNSEFDGNLGIYTVDDIEGTLFFKVKVDKTDASWINEKFEADWLVSRDESNQIWVRAVLSSSDSSQSPAIDFFKIRVI